MTSKEILQILPLGNVRLFRGIRRHLCFSPKTNSTLGKRASFSQNLQKWHPFSEHVRFSWTFVGFVRFSWTFSELLGNSTSSTLGKRASFSQNSRKWRHFSENVCCSPKLSDFRKTNNDFPQKNAWFPWNYSRLFEFSCSAYFLRLS